MGVAPWCPEWWEVHGPRWADFQFWEKLLLKPHDKRRAEDERWMKILVIFQTKLGRWRQWSKYRNRQEQVVIINSWRSWSDLPCAAPWALLSLTQLCPQASCRVGAALPATLTWAPPGVLTLTSHTPQSVLGHTCCRRSTPRLLLGALPCGTRSAGVWTPRVKLELMGVSASPDRQAALKYILYSSWGSPMEPRDRQWWRPAPFCPLHSLSHPPALGNSPQ